MPGMSLIDILHAAMTGWWYPLAAGAVVGGSIVRTWRTTYGDRTEPIAVNVMFGSLLIGLPVLGAWALHSLPDQASSQYVGRAWGAAVVATGIGALLAVALGRRSESSEAGSR